MLIKNNMYIAVERPSGSSGALGKYKCREKQHLPWQIRRIYPVEGTPFTYRVESKCIRNSISPLKKLHKQYRVTQWKIFDSIGIGRIILRSTRPFWRNKPTHAFVFVLPSFFLVETLASFSPCILSSKITGWFLVPSNFIPPWGLERWSILVRLFLQKNPLTSAKAA